MCYSSAPPLSIFRHNQVVLGEYWFFEVESSRIEFQLHRVESSSKFEYSKNVEYSKKSRVLDNTRVLQKVEYSKKESSIRQFRNIKKKNHPSRYIRSQRSFIHAAIDI